MRLIVLMLFGYAAAYVSMLVHEGGISQWRESWAFQCDG